MFFQISHKRHLRDLIEPYNRHFWKSKSDLRFRSYWFLWKIILGPGKNTCGQRIRTASNRLDLWPCTYDPTKSHRNRSISWTVIVLPSPISRKPVFCKKNLDFHLFFDIVSGILICRASPAAWSLFWNISIRLSVIELFSFSRKTWNACIGYFRFPNGAELSALRFSRGPLLTTRVSLKSENGSGGLSVTDRQTDRPTDRRTEFSKFAPDSIDMTFVAIRRFFRVSMVHRKNAKPILHFFQNVVTSGEDYILMCFLSLLG